MKLERPPRAIKANGHSWNYGRGRATGADDRRSKVCKSNQRGGVRPVALGTKARSACPRRRHVKSVFQRRRKTANVHAASGVSRKIPANRLMSRLPRSGKFGWGADRNSRGSRRVAVKLCRTTLPYSLGVVLFARAAAGVGTGKNFAAERDWPNGALGGIVAHFEAAIAGKARHGGDCLFFTAVFFGAAFFSRHRSEPNPACPHGRDDDGRTTIPRRGLVHACRIVIQNRREPALDLRDAHAAGVTSLPVYGGWERRSRRAVRRRHPDHRHYQKPCDKQADDSHEYPTFGFHILPP